MFGFGLQLPLPDTVTERVYHSLSAIQLSRHNVLLVAFGGQRSFGGDKLSDTVLVELSEYMYCSIVAIVTDSAQWYWCFVDIILLSLPIGMICRDDLELRWRRLKCESLHFSVFLLIAFLIYLTSPLFMQSREEMVSGWWGE